MTPTTVSKSEFKTYTPPTATDNEFIGLYHAPNNVIWAWNLSGELYYFDHHKLTRYFANELYFSLSTLVM